MPFSGFHQTVFNFLTANSQQQLFPQLTTHNNILYGHTPIKHALKLPTPNNHGPAISPYEMHRLYQDFHLMQR